MRTLLGLFVAAVLLTGAEGKGTATRGQPTAPANSNAWKYAAGGAVAGVTTYYIGSRLYEHHTKRNHDSYDDYYNSRTPAWKSRHPRRARTTCDFPSTGPRPEKTNAWVVTQVVANVTASSTEAPEVEVDFFNDITFRSCKAPTDIVLLYTCTFPGEVNQRKVITDVDRKNPNTCLFNGDTDLSSAHTAARRNLLQSDGDSYTVFELSIGSEDYAGTTDLVGSIKEMASDEDGDVKKHYGLYPIGNPKAIEIVDVEASAYLAPTLTTVLGAVMLVLLW